MKKVIFILFLFILVFIYFTDILNNKSTISYKEFKIFDKNILTDQINNKKEKFNKKNKITTIIIKQPKGSNSIIKQKKDIYNEIDYPYVDLLEEEFEYYIFEEMGITEQKQGINELLYDIIE